MSFGSSVIKYLLFTFNLLCGLLGLAVLLWGALNMTVYFEDGKVSHFLFTLPILLCIVGSVILLIAFFGCCGALLEIRCMLKTYGILIIVAFIVELLGVLALYLFYSEESLIEGLTTSMKYYDSDKDINKFWDLVNDDLHCCGVNSHADWGDNIPNSCCKHLDINDECHKEQAYEAGCLEKILNIFKTVIPILLGILLGVKVTSLCLCFCGSKALQYEDSVGIPLERTGQPRDMTKTVQ